jgi:hypothetical protein
MLIDAPRIGFGTGEVLKSESHQLIILELCISLVRSINLIV